MVARRGRASHKSDWGPKTSKYGVGEGGRRRVLRSMPTEQMLGNVNHDEKEHDDEVLLLVFGHLLQSTL